MEKRSMNPLVDVFAGSLFSFVIAIDGRSLGRRGNEWDGHPCPLPRSSFIPTLRSAPESHRVVRLEPLAGYTADRGFTPLPRRLAVKNSSPAAPLPPHDSGNAVGRRLDRQRLLSNHHRDALHLVVAHSLGIP